MLRNVEIEQRFSLDDLIARLKSQGQRLGLIIDLTDTDRYYDSRVSSRLTSPFDSIIDEFIN